MSKNSTDYRNLSDRELLARIVSEDSALELFQEHRDLESILLGAYREELKKVRGIGDKNSDRIKAVGEAVKRVLDKRKDEVEKVDEPEDVYRLNEDMVYLNQEEIRIVMLDIKKQVNRVETVSIGTTSSSSITPREVYSRALKSMSSGLIMVHNHPSGNPEPSDQDEKLTQRMINAGRTLSITLLDHIVIGRGCFISMRSECELDWY